MALAQKRITMPATNSDFGGSRLLFRKGEKSSHSLNDFNVRGRHLDKVCYIDFLLYGTLLAPHSPVEGIEVLYPGYSMGGANQYQGFSVQVEKRGIDYFVDELDSFFSDYFSRAYAESQPDALLLSGGIDSAILLSYMRNPKCVTWGGWGPESTDIKFSRVNAKTFGVSRHEFVYVDYDRDEEIYKQSVRDLRIPLLFANAVPFIRMSEAGRHMGIRRWYMGQNADTISCAYASIEAVRRLTPFIRYIPAKSWLRAMAFSDARLRKLFLLSTGNIPELFAYFKSDGIYPNNSLRVPDGYFDDKNRILDTHTRPQTLTQRIVLAEEFMTEARRNQIIQNEVPRCFGIETRAPYHERSVIKTMLSVPDSITRMDSYGKIVLKRLAERRGVPAEVIQKGKKGLSYGHADFIKSGRHIPMWKKMVKDDFLNEFIDVRVLRETQRDNFSLFDRIRSLFWYGELVVRPLNLI